MDTERQQREQVNGSQKGPRQLGRRKPQQCNPNLVQGLKHQHSDLVLVVLVVQVGHLPNLTARVQVLQKDRHFLRDQLCLHKFNLQLHLLRRKVWQGE